MKKPNIDDYPLKIDGKLHYYNNDLKKYIDFIEAENKQLRLHVVVKSLPTEESVRDWYKEGDIDDNFWKHSTEWSNEDVFKEVYKALKYFINRWQ